MHDIYEKALTGNDVETLDSLFWDSELAVRYGATENLYGAGEIRAFRQGRPKTDLARNIQRLEITSFGDSAGVINLEFVRSVKGVAKRGRQTQCWMKFDSEWKIVSAHVSLIQTAAYVEEAAGKISLPIAPSDRISAEMEFQRISAVADVMLQFPLDQAVEAAPVFQP